MSTTDQVNPAGEPSPLGFEASSDAAIVHDPKQRRSILVTVCVALMAVSAGVTGLNVAQPQLAIDLGASQSQVLWMINIYAISLAALLLPLGAVGDRWGRNPVLLVGLAMFGLANAASGFATSLEVMLAARFLSGVGAAMIMPVTLSVITSVFPDEERSKAIGVWTGVAGAGGVLGMFLSAVLIDMLSWRWLFVLPIILAVIAAIMAKKSVPNSPTDSRHSFDFVGALLSFLAIMAATFVLHEGPAIGWTAGETLAGLVLAFAAGIGFYFWERRQAEPLLDITLFATRSLTGGSVSLLTWFGVQAGVFIVLYPYFQAVLGWSALLATVGMMPLALLIMVFSSVAPRVSAQIGPRLTIAAGVLLGGVGLTLMAVLVSVDGGYLSVLPGLIVIGAGMGLAMTPSTEAITSSLPRERQGVASALNDVTRELGTSLGVALLGAVFAGGYRSAIASRLEGVPAEAAASVSRGIADAMVIAGQGLPYSDALYRNAQEAFVEGWQHAMGTGVVVMGMLLAFVLLRGPAKTVAVSHPPEKIFEATGRKAALGDSKQ